MEHYRYHQTYIPNTREERISDTVVFFSKQFNIPKMSYIDTTFNAPQNLIYALYIPRPENPLYKIGNGHKEALRNLAEIFSKCIPPEIPLRVTIREIVQEKPKEVNKERSQLKSASKATPSTNAEPLRVTIVEAYPA